MVLPYHPLLAPFMVIQSVRALASAEAFVAALSMVSQGAGAKDNEGMMGAMKGIMKVMKGDITGDEVKRFLWPLNQVVRMALSFIIMQNAISGILKILWDMPVTISYYWNLKFMLNPLPLPTMMFYLNIAYLGLIINDSIIDAIFPPEQYKNINSFLKIPALLIALDISMYGWKGWSPLYYIYSLKTTSIALNVLAPCTTFIGNAISVITTRFAKIVMLPILSICVSFPAIPLVGLLALGVLGGYGIYLGFKKDGIYMNTCKKVIEFMKEPKAYVSIGLTIVATSVLIGGIIIGITPMIIPAAIVGIFSISYCGYEFYKHNKKFFQDEVIINKWVFAGTALITPLAIGVVILLSVSVTPIISIPAAIAVSAIIGGTISASLTVDKDKKTEIREKLKELEEGSGKKSSKPQSRAVTKNNAGENIPIIQPSSFK